MKKLSEEDIKYYSKRLVHFLKGVRRRAGLSQEDVAKRIDYSISHYRKLELEGYADEGKYINAIDLLCSLGALEGMNLHQFALYLDNPDDMKIQDYLENINGVELDTEKRPIYPWEKLLIRQFNKIDMASRTEFIEKFMPNENNADGLIRMIKLSLIMEEIFLKKIKNFDLKLFDSLIEYVLVRLKTASEFRIKNSLISLSKLFSEK